jgi:hypothetical protein
LILRRVVSIIIALASYSAAGFADGNKVEPIGAFTDQSASDAVRKSLEPKGYRVTESDGGIICELWLRNGVVAGKTDVPGAVYTWIPESAFVGVINFPKGARDYRGQSIKPGAYTLRYAVHPADGNHLGISPIRDFLMMVPIGMDQNPDATFKFEELAKLSAKAAGTNHPGILSLVSPESKGPAAVSTNDHGHLVLSAPIKAASGEMPFAVIVKGIAEQ